jgi:hypothetical protein
MYILINLLINNFFSRMFDTLKMNSLLISRQLKFVFCIMGIDKTYSKALISIKSLVCSVIFMNKFININYKIEN